MSKNEITGRQAEQRGRVDACKARIVELVANEGAPGISTEELRGSLVRWRKADIDNAIRESVEEGAIVRGERFGSGGFRYRSPAAVKARANTVAALRELATATRKAAA